MESPSASQPYGLLLPIRLHPNYLVLRLKNFYEAMSNESSRVKILHYSCVLIIKRDQNE